MSRDYGWGFARDRSRLISEPLFSGSSGEMGGDIFLSRVRDQTLFCLVYLATTRVESKCMCKNLGQLFSHLDLSAFRKHEPL